MKYIDAEKLIAEIERLIEVHTSIFGALDEVAMNLNYLKSFITSLQQDKEVLDLCSQVWWEDRGWIMIPPDVTIKGIDSLLKQVRKKLRQEHPEQDLTEFEKALNSFGEAYATLVDRDNNPNQGIRINAYHELVQENINEILSLAKEYLQLEQSEVDLEKEIDRWFSEKYMQNMEGLPIKPIVQIIARHFYELGLNARKK